MLTDKNIYSQKTSKNDKYTTINFLAYIKYIPHQIIQDNVMIFAQCQWKLNKHMNPWNQIFV